MAHLVCRCRPSGFGNEAAHSPGRIVACTLTSAWRFREFLQLPESPKRGMFPQIWLNRRVAGSPDYLPLARGLRAGETSLLSAVHAASNFRERCAWFNRTRRLLFAYPAIINPDRKETQKTSTEISGWSAEIIHSSFNNTKTQNVRILLADE
jgi:hypothetical protein